MKELLLVLSILSTLNFTCTKDVLTTKFGIDRVETDTYYAVKAAPGKTIDNPICDGLGGKYSAWPNETTDGGDVLWEDSWCIWVTRDLDRANRIVKVSAPKQIPYVPCFSERIIQTSNTSAIALGFLGKDPIFWEDIGNEYALWYYFTDHTEALEFYDRCIEAIGQYFDRLL